jgi:hypothetical protein
MNMNKSIILSHNLMNKNNKLFVYLNQNQSQNKNKNQ